MSTNPVPRSLADCLALAEQPAEQGEPLTRSDYTYLLLITLVLPTVVLIIGGLS